MATKKKAPGTAVVVVHPDAQPQAGNPHSWLHLLGSDAPSDQDRFMFGVLRPEYREWTNTAAEFTRRKISVVPHPSGDPWALTAERCEVLLPKGADDRLRDPQALLKSVDEERPHDRNSLLAYVTISEPGTQRLHEQWSRAHAWAVDLVREHGCPIVMVQHAPHRRANGNPPHLHLMLCGPRKLGPLGWTTYIPDLCHDRGRGLLLASWEAHKESWG